MFSKPTHFQLRALNLQKELGSQTLWSQINVTLMPKERAFLVGPNGSGKTMLLQALLGIETLDEGRVHMRGSFQYLPQHLESFCHASLLDFFCLRSSNQALRSFRDTKPETGCPAFFLNHGGYRYIQALQDLGMKNISLDRPFQSLSSGEKLKAFFSLVTIDKPDLLFLDEPTNHIDKTTLEWLIPFLNAYHGILFSVSHDRAFIDSVATKIYELQPGIPGLESISGKYAHFLQMRDQKRKNMEQSYIQNTKYIKKMNSLLLQKVSNKKKFKGKKDHDKITAHWRSASQQRVESTQINQIKKKLDQLKHKTSKSLPPSKLSFPALPPNSLDRFENWWIPRLNIPIYQGTFCLQIPEFSFGKGDRIFLTGANGSGKSSLLKYLAGRLLGALPPILPPEHIGFLAQEEDLNTQFSHFCVQDYFVKKFSPHRSLTDVMRTVKEMGLLRDTDLSRPISALSLGERRRLSLLELFLSQKPILILDEPTNHMDISTMEALEGALRTFPGLLIASSHDTWLIHQLATRKLECNEGKIREGIFNRT